MPQLYLVRHAEPETTGVLLGHCDPSLSEEGRRAAARLSLDARVIYASALRRARETAVACAGETPVVILPELNEISYGEWDGRSWNDIAAAHPALAAAKLADWNGVTPPGGEPWAAFEQRVRRAVEHMLCGALPAAVVAHAAVNGIIAETLTGAAPLEFSQNYGEVTRIDF